MRLMDSHTHTSASADASSPLIEMAEAAIKSGIDILSVTDHCDIGFEEEIGKIDSKCLSKWQPSLAQYREVSPLLEGKIELLMGIELAYIDLSPELAREITATPELDFVIGSVHALKDGRDFYILNFHSMEQCIDLARRYVEENINIAKIGCFDVLAHLGYINRYMKKAGFYIDLTMFEDRLRALLTLLIESGKGIEVNTSGLRQGLGSTFPDKKMLKLYRDCGGELVTIGSDAHRPQDVGANIPDGLELLRELGFKYVSVFRERKPSFIPI